MDLSPFTHLPRSRWAADRYPVIWLTATALLSGAAGLAGLRLRDIS